MAGGFNDSLAKGLGLGNTAVGVIMVVMASLLPLGVLSEVLDLSHHIGVKLLVGGVLSLFSLLAYIRYVRALKLSPVVWGFGLVMSAGVPLLTFVIVTDFVLKAVGLE
jgi:hypothetical protein